MYWICKEIVAKYRLVAVLQHAILICSSVSVSGTQSLWYIETSGTQRQTHRIRVSRKTPHYRSEGRTKIMFFSICLWYRLGTESLVYTIQRSLVHRDRYIGFVSQERHLTTDVMKNED